MRLHPPFPAPRRAAAPRSHPFTPLRFRALLTGILLPGMLVLSACSAPAPADPTVAESDTAAEPEPVEAAEPAGLEGTDFGNLPWTYRPGGDIPETVQIDLVDGAATEGTASYEVGEVILTDLTGDGRADAAVQITQIDGNAIDEQWYLWVATDGGPAQVTLPVARMSQCGTVVHSVTAVDSGGVEIHESLRAPGDDAIACSDPGTDERTRTVHAIEARNSGEWWPVQTAPFGGFGGLCPNTAHLDGYPNETPLFAVPDAAATDPIELSGEAFVFEIESWPVYGEPFPGWVLAGLQEGGERGCAWAEVP